MAAVSTSQSTSRLAARMSRAARVMASAHETLVELPISPTRLILANGFFKQHQKFLVARRPGQRRLGGAAPGERACGHQKGFQFAENALVDRGVRDDAAAFGGFLPAGFELRFDERDDPAVIFHKIRGGGKDFCQ